MAEFPSLPLFTDAYIGDTAHLTNEEHGVYLRMLMFAWRSPNCALPNDDKRLAIMVGVTPKKWASLRDTILGFWTLTNEGWQQDRLTFERQRVKVSMDQKVAAGKASARAKSRKTNKPTPTDVGTNDGSGVATAGQQPIPTPSVEDKSSTQEAAIYQRYLEAHPNSIEGKACEVAFSELIKAGEDPEQIIASAKAYADHVKDWSSEAKVQQSDNFLGERGKWREFIPKPKAPRPSENERAEFWAAKVKGDGYVAPSAIGAGLARLMVERGLVTPEQLKAKDIVA